MGPLRIPPETRHPETILRVGNRGIAFGLRTIRS